MGTSSTQGLELTCSMVKGGVLALSNVLHFIRKRTNELTCTINILLSIRKGLAEKIFSLCLSNKRGNHLLCNYLILKYAQFLNFLKFYVKKPYINGMNLS